MPFFGGSSGGSLGSTVEIAEIESLAKGALIVGDGDGAPSIFTPGADGASLVFDSTQPSGVRAEVITGGGSEVVKYQLTVTSGMIASRTFDLQSAPANDEAWLSIVGVGDQELGADYEVSGVTVSWGPSGGLFDVLAENDVLIVEYIAA